MFPAVSRSGLPPRFLGRLILEYVGRLLAGGGSRIVWFSPQGNIDGRNHSHFVTQVPTRTNHTAHCSAIGGDSSLQEKYPCSGHLFVVDLPGYSKGDQLLSEYNVADVFHE